VTHKRCFVELDDLDEPRINMLEAVLIHELLDSSLNIIVDLLLDVLLSGEDIQKK
jgi:hypothetical protein